MMRSRDRIAMLFAAMHESAFGPKQTCRKTQTMSLLGVNRTCACAPHMSAFDPKRTSRPTRPPESCRRAMPARNGVDVGPNRIRHHRWMRKRTHVASIRDFEIVGFRQRRADFLHHAPSRLAGPPAANKQRWGMDPGNGVEIVLQGEHQAPLGSDLRYRLNDAVTYGLGHLLPGG